MTEATAARTALSREKRATYLAALREARTVKAAIKEAGISRPLLTLYRKTPEFLAAEKSILIERKLGWAYTEWAKKEILRHAPDVVEELMLSHLEGKFGNELWHRAPRAEVCRRAGDVRLMCRLATWTNEKRVEYDPEFATEFLDVMDGLVMAIMDVTEFDAIAAGTVGPDGEKHIARSTSPLTNLMRSRGAGFRGWTDTRKVQVENTGSNKAAEALHLIAERLAPEREKPAEVAGGVGETHFLDDIVNSQQAS